ncbi:50S ribosomal protein L25 [Paenibacillus lemnae]|uniref:Large ribosomal subunit protein bL25 n=1 Tax=Paenibacillus lemnae TaxID=1330551 RepID=A0A848M865_PAELE|nr:50S ribosomal protein L25 [Paenibacillus lemnae]NMO96806.1 50S ribosomal protein L25 [Paenibacillus lemnae]
MTSKRNSFQLEAEVRNEFTRASRRTIRESGGVPGVVYGAGTESIPVSVDLKDASKLFHKGRSESFKLNIKGSDSLPVLIKDVQQRGGKFVHVDFLHISMNKPVRVTIPVSYQGEAVGTKSGGIVQTQVTELDVEGLPNDLPSVIEADISSLEIGDRLTVADLELPKGITLYAEDEEVLASVIVPRVVEAADTDAESDTEDGAVAEDGNQEAEGTKED